MSVDLRVSHDDCDTAAGMLQCLTALLKKLSGSQHGCSNLPTAHSSTSLMTGEQSDHLLHAQAALCHFLFSIP